MVEEIAREENPIRFDVIGSAPVATTIRGPMLYRKNEITRRCFRLIVAMCFAVLFMPEIFAAALPPFQEKKVIGLDIFLYADYHYRVVLCMIDKHGTKIQAQVWPTNESSSNRAAYRYYQEHVADLPILTKKMNTDFGEDIRQDLIKRKKEAIAARSKAINEEKRRAEADAILFDRMNSLFGMKIGAVAEGSNIITTGEVLRASNIFRFIPEKKFLNFDKYEILCTPKSRRIVAIAASAPYSKKDVDIVRVAVEKKFGTTLKKEKDVYTAVAWKGNNYRFITFYRDKKSGRLDLSITDHYGLKQAEKEDEAKRDSVAEQAAEAL